MMFHLIYRHKLDKVWHKFGLRFENNIDLKDFRKRYRDHRFKLLFEPVEF